jgi:carboxypeptidase Taq
VTPAAQAAYDQLLQRTREASLLASCAELLGWDELTYLPRRGVEHRGNQLALLAGLQHERATDPRVGELLDVLEDSDLLAEPDSPAAANYRVIRRAYRRQVRVPRALVEELARATSFAQQVWADTREHGDYASLQPWLERIVSLKRREAESLGPDGSLYDALLDEYEPGVRAAELVPLFEALRRELLPLLHTLVEARRRPNVAILRRAFPIERQRALAQQVAAALGFDFERGRLDTTPHPFFGSIGPGDCRITTRFSVHDFADGFFGLLHEVGHGLYEQGLDPAHQGTPLGESPSLGLHESQSRLWENIVGRGLPFWVHFFPLLCRTFPEVLADVTRDEFHFAVNRVAPSCIRVGADEVTYNLHIMVRFELEQALLAGDLRAADVPAAWNEAYQRYLSVTPKNDAEGCLQDGHWSSGLIGYFPTYTLGNLFAAQLFAQAERDLGDMGERFGRGDFSDLLGWLRTRVHRVGSRYPAARVIEHATGSEPDYRPLIAALQLKYSRLYGV